MVVNMLLILFSVLIASIKGFYVPFISVNREIIDEVEAECAIIEETWNDYMWSVAGNLGDAFYKDILIYHNNIVDNLVGRRDGLVNMLAAATPFVVNSNHDNDDKEVKEEEIVKTRQGTLSKRRFWRSVVNFFKRWRWIRHRDIAPPEEKPDGGTSPIGGEDTKDAFNYNINDVKRMCEGFDWLTDSYISSQFRSFRKTRINNVDFLFLFVWGHILHLNVVTLDYTKCLIQFLMELIAPVYYTCIGIVFIWCYAISAIITAFTVVALPHFSDEPLTYIRYLESCEKVLGEEGFFGSVNTWIMSQFSVDLSKEFKNLVVKILGPIPGFFSFINDMKQRTHHYCLGLTPTIFDAVIRSVTESDTFIDFRLFFSEAIGVNFFVVSFDCAVLLFAFGVHMNTCFVLFFFIFTTWIAAIVGARHYLRTPSYDARDVKLVKWKLFSIYGYFALMAVVWEWLDIRGKVNTMLVYVLPGMNADTRFRIVTLFFAVPWVVTYLNSITKKIASRLKRKLSFREGILHAVSRSRFFKSKQVKWIVLLLVLLMGALLNRAGVRLFFVSDVTMTYSEFIDVLVYACIAVMPMIFFMSHYEAEIVRDADTLDEYVSRMLPIAEQRLHSIPGSVAVDFSFRLALHVVVSYFVSEMNRTLMQWKLVRWGLSGVALSVDKPLEDIITRVAYYFGVIGFSFFSENDEARANAPVIFLSDMIVYCVLLASPMAYTSLSSYLYSGTYRRLSMIAPSTSNLRGIITFLKSFWDSGALPRTFIDSLWWVMMWWVRRAILAEYGYLSVIFFLAFVCVLHILYTALVSLYYLVDKKLTTGQTKKVYDIGEQFGSVYSKYSYAYLLGSAHGHQQNRLFKHLLLFSDMSDESKKDCLLNARKTLKLIPLLMTEMGCSCVTGCNLACGTLDFQESYTEFEVKARDSERKKLEQRFMNRVYIVGMPAALALVHFLFSEFPLFASIFVAIVVIVTALVTILFKRNIRMSIEDDERPWYIIAICPCIFPHEAMQQCCQIWEMLAYPLLCCMEARDDHVSTRQPMHYNSHISKHNHNDNFGDAPSDDESEEHNAEFVQGKWDYQYYW